MNARSSKTKTPLVTIITPAFNESQNLPILLETLSRVLGGVKMEWEWIIVDDHSSDDTFSIASEFAKKDTRVHAYRFSRNYGSHMALRCGLDHAAGQCAVGMAADMQDSPETIPELIEKWKTGCHVVWAARENRVGEKQSTLIFSRWYHRIMRDVVGLTQLPLEGADFFLLDRRVIDAVNQFPEKNVSLFALISWLGFDQAVIHYDKHARQHGSSGWSLEKKIKMAVDSVTSFSFKPIRLMTVSGLVIAALAFFYLLVILANYLRGVAPEGWTSLMAAILLIGGLQIMMIGILGEYIWRSLDESRNRPRYTIEDETGIGKND